MIPRGDDALLVRRPIAVYALVAANLAVLVYAAGKVGYADVVAAYGFSPTTGDLATLSVALFLPANVLHLAFNALFLIGIGQTVEDTIGRPATLLYYIAGGALGLGLYYIFHPAGTVPVIAISGGTGAILAAYLVLYPQAQIRFRYWAWYWEGSFFLPAWSCVALWFGVEFVMGYQGFAATNAYPLGHWVVVTGMIAGGVLAFPIRLMAARLAEQYADTAQGPLRMPAVVQQRAQARWRAVQSESGEFKPDKEAQWAAGIAERLAAGHQTRAIRLFESHSSAHSLSSLEPRTQYELAEACLAKGRYWRAATLLEHLLSGSIPGQLETKAHTLLAALYGEHPYFHESATPHLDLALAALSRNSEARVLLRDVAKKVDAARVRDLTVRKRDRFCLLRETAETYRIAEAGPIVARATNQELKAVLRDLRNNPGILAWKVPRQQAFDLAATLAHAGIHVGLVPLSALIGYGKTEAVDHISVKVQGLQLETAQGPLRVSWDEIALVCGGFLVLTTDQQQKVYEEAHEAALASGDSMASFDSMLRELRHITLMDVWLKKPQRHLRIREHPLRMPEAQMQSIASTILRTAPTLPKNNGLVAVAGGVVPPDCLFDGRDYFTYHGTWQRYLRNWDELPAVADSLLYNLAAALRKSI